MVNIEQYYKDILDRDREKKIERNMVLVIILSFIFIISSLIGTGFMISGLGLNLFNKDYWLKIYAIGMVIFAFGVAPFIILESRDMLRGYSTNKKLFIYLYFLLISLNKLKEKSKYRNIFYYLYVREIISNIYKEMLKINNNLKNLFIIETDDNIIELMDNILNVVNNKLFTIIKESKLEIAIELTDDLIALHEINIFNNIINDIEYKKILYNSKQSFKIQKLDKLYNVLKEISEIDETNKNYKIIHKMKKVFSNKYFVAAISLLLCSVSIYFFKVTKTAEIVTLVSGVPGIIALIVSISKKE